MGIVALAIFIVVTVIWNGLLRRPIAEALIVALLGCALTGGLRAPELLANAIASAATSDIVYAAVTFVLVSVLLSSTGVIDRLIAILRAGFGWLPGGSAYVSTLSSAAVGLVAGSTAANTATVGAVTIPWMKSSGWSAERSATLVAGNSGLGVALPPNSSMFILLATPGAIGVATGDLYLALLAAGGYFILYRMILVTAWTRRFRLTGSRGEGPGLLSSLRDHWPSMLIFIGIVAPLVVTVGPVRDRLASSPTLETEALDSISLIVWVPVLITVITCVLGWRTILKSPLTVIKRVVRERSQFATVGVSTFAALAASEVMQQLGVGNQITDFFDGLDAPRALIVLIVCLLTVIVATPLSSTATAAAVGAPGILALVAAGVPPVVAVVTILLCASTEGSSPPVGSPIYLASGFADVSPARTFVPLIVYFVLPAIVIAWLVGMSILPVIT